VGAAWTSKMLMGIRHHNCALGVVRYQDAERAGPLSDTPPLEERTLSIQRGVLTATFSARVARRSTALVIRAARITLIRITGVASLGSVANTLIALRLGRTATG